jgi:ketosteroid isomerase-like protein
MYRWLVRRALEWMLADLRRGRTRVFVKLLADDVRFRFPGDHSWAADHHGKEAVARWLERYVRTGLRLYPREIVVSGPPWNMTVCTWFVDEARGHDGETVYRNEGVLVDRLVRGRIKEHVSFEDTQKTAEFDAYLRSTGAL